MANIFIKYMLIRAWQSFSQKNIDNRYLYKKAECALIMITIHISLRPFGRQRLDIATKGDVSDCGEIEGTFFALLLFLSFINYPSVRIVLLIYFFFLFSISGSFHNGSVRTRTTTLWNGSYRKWYWKCREASYFGRLCHWSFPTSTKEDSLKESNFGLSTSR